MPAKKKKEKHAATGEPEPNSLQALYNKEQHKEKFYEQVDDFFAQQKRNTKPISKEEFRAIFTLLNTWNKEESHTKEQHALRMKYVIVGAGLGLRGKVDFEEVDGALQVDVDKVRFVVCYEDLFETLYQAHLATNHQKERKMYNKLKESTCGICAEVCAIYLTGCWCQQHQPLISKERQLKPIITVGYNFRMQIDLIDMQSKPSKRGHKWILSMVDHGIKFALARPLFTKRAEEIAQVLLIIFLEQGAPRILQSDNGREFINAIIKALKDLWASLVLVSGKARHKQSNGGVERWNWTMEQAIGIWMREFGPAEDWDFGIYFCVEKYNNTWHRTIKAVPYALKFGQTSKTGISIAAGLKPHFCRS